jgi:Prokaryotic E2 family A/ThiF family
MAEGQASSKVLPESVRRALKQIAEHPHVKSIEPQKAGGADTDTSHEVIVYIETNLPAAWRASGVSPETGVRLFEPVRFVFPATFPTNPPRIYLRQDFNRSLPHIQPGNLEGPVEPCYLDGDPRELLHQQGILGIINQIVIWLERAAKNELIDPRQGWEPIRRDNVDDDVVADIPALRTLVGKREDFSFLPVDYLRLFPEAKDRSPSKGYFFRGMVRATPMPINSERLQEFSKRVGRGDSLERGESFAVYVSPGRLPSGQPFVCDRYQPETDSNAADLVTRAHAYGCGKALEEALEHLKRQSAGLTSLGFRLPVIVLLAVRRPLRMIGSDSDIEIIPYLIEMSAPAFTEPPEKIEVYPAALRQAISKELLSRLSGVRAADDRNIVQLGCGSLGSKIAIHLARAGIAPARVVDKQSLSPHNAARHALIPCNEQFQIFWMARKATALAEAIQGLGQDTDAVDADVASIGNDGAQLHKSIPRKTWAVVNSTAALAVRETLAGLKPEMVPARVIETSLFADGNIGVLTIEGPARIPNTADLILETYEVARSDPALREKFFGEAGGLQRREIGQGCGSVTMTVSDAVISLFAAAMANKVQALRQNDLPGTGQVLVGRICADKMGLEWYTQNIIPYHIVHAENDRSWHIRISPRAHTKITEDIARYPDTETGGIVVGALSEHRKTITVIDVLPAPPDSQRSASAFVLGTHGVSKLLEDYSDSTAHALYCVGTWHSHLADMGGSARDYVTSAIIAAGASLPLVLLIRTPASYRAVLAIDA